MQSTDTVLQQLVQSILQRRDALDTLAGQLRTPGILAAFDKWNHESWCISTAGDALIRLRLFTEQNFVVLETIGVVGVARYTFELALWLRLFALDGRYGLVYYDQLLETQQRFYQDTLDQLNREVTWLKSLYGSENLAHKEILKALDGVDPSERAASRVSAELSSASAAIDAQAARRFSVYGEAARTQGYGFQAHLIETKAIPQTMQALTDIGAERTDWNSRVPPETKALRPKRWQWRLMAEKVGREDEYDYLYSYASKLLHATPASITTDEKNLSAPEMVLFLRYIDVTIGDVLMLATAYVPRAGLG